jgi:uncharacterized metal-binding protein YceD (DUF177 family)
MDALAPFRIPVATLKADEASYEWGLGPEFLAIFDDEHEPVDGQFTVGMELHKAAGIATLEFSVDGSIQTTCDRCLVPLQLPIEAEYQLIVKFGDPNESTDEVVFIDPEASDLNVGQHIYDFILLSIPISHRIPDCETMENSPCDTSILSYLTQNENNILPGDDDDESPWNEIKKVIDN